MAASTPPPLANMTPTPQATFEERQDGAELKTLLDTMTLQAFTDHHGHIWIGLIADDVHEHDRWFYHVPYQIGNDLWDQLPYAVLLGCDQARLQMDNAGLVLELQSLATAFITSAEALPTAQQRPLPELARNYLLAVQRFDWLLPKHMRRMLAARWGVELHDLLEHYEVWAARNEPALPRDVALRMYGLGAYVDALQCGEDWLATA